jgi:hypothetical protein
MDYSLVSAAVTAMSVAKELGKAALGIRDFNEIATVMAQLNDHLLKAQEALFAHNAQLLALQQEQFETTKELREVKEALAQRGRYALVELSDRVFVYRVNVAPIGGDVSDPLATEPLHYVCQSCFDKGIKSVLQKHRFYGAVSLTCPVCKGDFPTGTSEPYRTL